MMTAGNITKQQAEAIARTFLGKHRPAVVNQQVRMTQKKAMPRSGASDAAAYYVFNVGSELGYVLVNGSDKGPQILGYADKGTFSEKAIPSNMKAWLDGYINVTDIATVIDAILGKTTLNGAKGSTVVFSNTHTVTPQPVAGEVPPTMVRNIFKR
jgi:hypothetical protein